MENTNLSVLEVSDEDFMKSTSPDSYIPAEEIKDTDIPGTEGEAELKPEGADDVVTDVEDSTESEDVTTDSVDVTDADEPEALKLAKAQLDKLFTPFQANGKEIKVDNIEDAIRLMQMGAGFNKKMATLKPHLKLMKMLDNNGLLTEEKLAFLIDINKKDPAAISKLLAESNIDPLNLTQGNEYTPGTYTVSDSELELKDALDDLKDSQHFNQVTDVILNKLDDSSKKLLIGSPSNIRVLHDHMASGIYQKVMGRVENQRALGHLNGLSDLEAYKQVGDVMFAAGEFGQAPTNPKPNTAPATKGTVDESKLKNRKLAASPTKSSPGTKQNSLANFNPLTATDEEIANMTLDKFV